MAPKLCLDPAHKDTPTLAVYGDDRVQCPLCGGVRLSFNPPDEDLDLAPTLYDDPNIITIHSRPPDPAGVWKRGSPKTPEAAEAAFNAIVEQDARARLMAEEAAIRAELTTRIQAAIEHTVDHGPYGDASGHLGGDGFRAMSEAAVEAFANYYRERKRA